MSEALTVGELVERLRRFPSGMKLRMTDDKGDLMGVHGVEVIADRVILKRLSTFVPRPRRRYR